MKKIMKYALALAILPCILLVGCGGEKIKLKTQSFEPGKLIYDNVIEFTDDVRAFETLSAEFTQSLNTDASQKLTFGWNLINNINKNFTFIMPALDMRINNRAVWSYNLSNVSTTLSDFTLSLTNSDNANSKAYIYYYSSNINSLDQNSPLPQPVVKTPGYTTDKLSVETIIKSMGLALKYKVSPANDYQVEVYSEFVYPTQAEVPEMLTGSIEMGDYLEIMRDDDGKVITIIYQLQNGNLAKKEVNFKTDSSTGKIRKIITFSECTDMNTLPYVFTPNSLKNYEYDFSSSELIGTYKNIKAYNDTGFFKGEQVITNQISNKLEFFMLKDGNIMANYNAKEGTTVTTAELLIYNGGSNGKLKYKNGSHKIESIEDIFKNDKEQSFTKITNAERSATTKTYQFKFKDTETTCSVAGR